MLLNGKFIFIVEDDPQSRIVFQIALNHHGAWTWFEAWGLGALEHLKQLHRVHLVILNLTLHRYRRDYDYDLLTQIRSLSHMATVPIVAATSADPQLALFHTQQRGFDGLLLKPLDGRILPQQLERVMQGEKLWPMPAL
jgi:CheY-like chemotaxis protein